MRRILFWFSNRLGFKKVIKLLAVVVGLFLGALIYLETQTIININWDKLQFVSKASLSTIGNSISTQEVLRL